PYVTVLPYNRRLDADTAAALVADYDLVIDGVDDPATRRAVNAACVAAGVPLISGALSQWEGQVAAFDPTRGGPCYACVFPEDAAQGLAPSCAEAGVLGPLPGVIGTMMAVEAVKIISGAGTPLWHHMIIYDALDAETRKIKITPRPGCPVCGGTGGHA
ncbi:MAG: HesA/MoeB/ThiF family protein, partial [Pseudomonadota bacterium]